MLLILLYLFINFIEYAKKLQHFGRNADQKLLNIFNSSFDDIKFNISTFDKKFFIKESKYYLENKKIN